MLVTVAGIAFALALTRVMRIDPATGALISGETAICGGSAIAALRPALGASIHATAPAYFVGSHPCGENRYDESNAGR